MASCCDARGCDEFFGSGFARSAARRYRRRGLDKTASRIVGFLETQGVRGATVLEIGGGVGEIQIELLRRGAERAVNLELSGAYEAEAERLLDAARLRERGERRIHDIAADPSGVEPADVVVLHRVVCCYPDYERLLRAAGSHALRLLVFSHPPANRLARALIGVQNLVLRLRRMRFRAFVHPPPAMLGVLAEQGLRPTFAHTRGQWHVQGLERGGPRAEVGGPEEAFPPDRQGPARRERAAAELMLEVELPVCVGVAGGGHGGRRRPVSHVRDGARSREPTASGGTPSPRASSRHRRALRSHPG